METITELLMKIFIAIGFFIYVAHATSKTGLRVRNYNPETTISNTARNKSHGDKA